MLHGLIWMAVLSGLIIILIVVINWLPSQIQQNTALQYTNLESARRSLGIDKILVPVYMPEGISWPPSLIVAQKKPFLAVVMEFKSQKTGETQLFIIQSSSRDAEERFQKVSFSDLKEETEYILKGKKAVLRVGFCGEEIECSKMIWEDSGMYYSVFLMSSSFNLIQISESMIR